MYSAEDLTERPPALTGKDDDLKDRIEGIALFEKYGALGKTIQLDKENCLFWVSEHDFGAVQQRPRVYRGIERYFHRLRVLWELCKFIEVPTHMRSRLLTCAMVSAWDVEP